MLISLRNVSETHCGKMSSSIHTRRSHTSERVNAVLYKVMSQCPLWLHSPVCPMYLSYPLSEKKMPRMEVSVAMKKKRVRM